MARGAQIAFAICYFGGWPRFWRLWAESVATNPSFDFLIFTDLPNPDPLPPNIRIVPMSQSEFLRRISDAVGISGIAAGLHKLCDYRPFFGLAFADILGPYAYWGYCDVDLVFGDLTPLLTAVATSQADFISPWDHTVGHCTLIRNDERTNRVGLEIKDLATRVLKPTSTFMDEGGLFETAYHRGFSLFFVQDLTAEWTQPECFLGATCRPDGTLAASKGRFIAHYTNGRVFVYDERLDRHEVLYFHFMGLKAPRFWKHLEECDARELSFTPYGLVPGLLDPALLLTAGFKGRCELAMLPGRAYRAVRNRIPHGAIQRINELRRRLRVR